MTTEITLPKDIKGEVLNIGDKVIVEILSPYKEKVMSSYEAEIVINKYSICTEYLRFTHTITTPLSAYGENVRLTKK